MEKGEGFASTWHDIKAIATEDGALNFRPGYWENVYRTNTQTAYTAGKLMHFKDNPPPAWRLLIIDDNRTSDICRGLMRDGKQSLTMASDHPFWESFGFPPYHFQCRTGLQAVYKSEIGQGANIENPSMKSLRKEFKPMDGFGGNPLDKESWWMMTESMAKRASNYGIDGDIILLAKNLGMKNYAMEKLNGFETLFSSDSGGYVKKATRANPGIKNLKLKNKWVETDELGAATRAAESGHKVFFMPQMKLKGVSDLDVIIDNDLGDIKHIFTPTENAIIEALNRAKRQGATSVLLDIVTPDLTIDFVKPVVKKQLGKHLKIAIILFGKTEYKISI